MKSFRWLILLLTLTAAALLPNLPEIDAQSRCPRGVQIQQFNLQSQKTRQYQQQIYQQQQMVAKKQWEQSRQMQITQQQRQVEQRTRQIQQAKTATQIRSMPAQVPLTQTRITSSSRQITTQAARLVPHGPGVNGRVPTAIHSTTRTIDSYLVSRRVDMVPVNRSVATQSRALTQRPHTITNQQYTSRQITAQSRTLHQDTRTITMQSRKLVTMPRTCNEQTTITTVKWNMTCIACHQQRGLPYPTGPQRPHGPQIVHTPKQPRLPDAIPLPAKLPVDRDPWVRPVAPRLLPDPLVRLPGPTLYPWVQPPRPVPVVRVPQRPLPEPWLRPDYPFRPGLTLRPDYAWTKPAETTRTLDSPGLRLPGDDPIATPKPGPKQLNEAIVSGNATPRLLPTDLLEMPTLPTGIEGLTRRPDHAEPEAGRAQDDHGAPQVKQTPLAMLSDEELLVPGLLVLPRSVLMLAPLAEEKAAVADLQLEPDLPPPDLFDLPARDTDRLVRATPTPQSSVRPPVSTPEPVSLDVPSASTRPRSILGPG
ncbi:MAG: hypothetical protein L0Z62_15845 [Gemmataceae bacterium]|nr:hypothetical protein [Gemmataceae bacterium]